ncbi:type I restriction enzyme [Streptococcus pneumoniae]|nr:type I restriction enzyme [Streptococcus pneumoniae]VRN63156.1 type I restriction enzyme [Streptococcus pneumoniae]
MNWVVIKIKDIFSMNTGLSYKKGDLSINNKGVTRIYLRKTATEQQNIVDKIVNW